MKWNITIIRPRGFPHSSGFAEVADSVAWSLCALGHEATITHNWFSKTERNIVFGAELLAYNQQEPLPPGTIIFQLEQPSHPNLAKVQAIAQFGNYEVWDYSLTNVRNWQRLGVNCRHVPIGYTPNLTRIPKAEVQDIDVLFLGWITPRREKILNDLRDAGLKIVASSNCYGGGRDNLISRAKVLLNCHHDGRNLFEAVRVSYYLANSKCVVSELSADDAEYQDIRGGIFLTDEIVATCQNICQYDLREQHESDALKAITKRDFTATIQAALTEPTPQEKVAKRFAEGCKSGDMQSFMHFLRDHAKGTCMEIGVRDGASTAAILRGLEGRGGVLLSCDIADCGGLFRSHPQWKFIQSDSQNPKLKVPELDFLLIDGNHTRFGYRADLDRYFPLVKPGGMILSHDINPAPEITLEATGDPERPSKYIRDEYFAFAEHHNLAHEELPGENGMGVMWKCSPAMHETVETFDASWKRHSNDRPDSDESWQASEALLNAHTVYQVEALPATLPKHSGDTLKFRKLSAEESII